jgi:hypothetical protein
VLDRNLLQFYPFEAPDIDRAHPIPLRIGALSIRVNAARLAKAVLDHVPVERVRAYVVIRRKHMQLVARHKPQK